MNGFYGPFSSSTSGTWNCIRAVCIAVLLLLPFAASADSSVGEIAILSGEVAIDAFGTGDFIRAITGDVLYRQSVVRTGPGATAILRVDGETTEVASDSALSIGQLVRSHERVNKFGWLRQLSGAVKSAFDAVTGEKEEVVLGGRAGNANDNDDEVGWIVEDENEDAYREALILMAEDDFVEAVSRLKEIFDPLPGIFLPGEIEFWIGYCQYQLENYTAALEAYEAALQDIRLQRFDSRRLKFHEEILFQSGSSHYLIGNFAGAATAMASLADHVSDRYGAYTYLILIDSLLEMGSIERARSYLAEAASRIVGSGLDDEFATLQRRLR